MYLYRGVCGNTTATYVIHPLLGEGGEEEEAERILPDDFYYDFDGLVSTAFSTEGIPLQLLSFQYPLCDFSPYYYHFLLPANMLFSVNFFLPFQSHKTTLSKAPFHTVML